MLFMDAIYATTTRCGDSRLGREDYTGLPRMRAKTKTVDAGSADVSGGRDRRVFPANWICAKTPHGEAPERAGATTHANIYAFCSSVRSCGLRELWIHRILQCTYSRCCQCFRSWNCLNQPRYKKLALLILGRSALRFGPSMGSVAPSCIIFLKLK